MKPYAVTLLISITIIFILRIFYSNSIVNLSHNVNLFSASEIKAQEVKTLVYLYLAGLVFLNYLIFHKHILFKLVYCLLIALNILLIISSLKQF
ncbi:putative membrane protein [Chryseobacterium sp. PvR013]|nr:putative membrane protein [Chryseobacterium sp. PvR013]